LIEESIRNVYADDSRVTDMLVDQYMDMALREGNRKAFISRIATPLSDSTYLKIPTLQQRTLVLWGAQDYLIPVDNAYRFHRDLPNDTLVVIPNVGHVPMEEMPTKSVRIVRAFLDK
jgi:pimeloyl-ACP methyl ester carboxylesterase